jgi:hypothetical protein
MADTDRFAQTVGRVKGKRIAYEQLTGKGDGLRQGWEP